MSENKCKFCGSGELVYHQYIGDSKCQSCGSWQNVCPNCQSEDIRNGHCYDCGHWIGEEDSDVECEGCANELEKGW